MHVEMIGSGRDGAVLQHDLLRVDAPHVAEADDVLDSAKLLQLPRAHRPALHHGRHDGSVGAEHHVLVFEAFVHLLHRVRHGHRLELEDDARKGPGLPGLEERPIEDPGVTGTDPRDVIRIGTAIEQPADGVQRGLAAADDHVPRGRLRERGELADRDAADPIGHLERNRFRRRDTRGHVGRVDDPAANGHLRHPLGHPGTETPLAQVVAHREEPDPPRRQEPVTHDLVEVATDLRTAGPLEEAGVQAFGFAPVLSECRRVDAVEPRRLVQLHEWIRVQPMAARPVASLDHHDVGVAVIDQRVDERHPERARTDDEIVRLEPHVTRHAPER